MSRASAEGHATTARELDEDGRNALFDALQARMPRCGAAMRSDDPRESVVVVPSMTLDRVVGELRRDEPGAGGALPVLAPAAAPAAAADGLRDLACRSTRSIVDYYLSLLPGVIPSHARSRLVPGLRRRLRPRAAHREAARPARGSSPRSASSIPDRSLSHLVPYNTTTLERDLALLLGIPMYRRRPTALPARHQDRVPAALRARPGCATRRALEDLHTRDDLEAALVDLRRDRPGHPGGDGQAQRGRLRLRQRGRRPRRPPAPGTAAGAGGGGRPRRRRWSSRTPGSTSTTYLAKLDERGGIVEERVVGDELRSPSVQMRVTPLGEVEVLSTHDQVLGGPSGQSYLGCRFPADPAYADADHRGRPTGRRPPRREGRARPLRRRLRHRRDGVSVAGRRHRGQPAQGRHHPPVPDPAVPHRRPLRPGPARFLTPAGRSATSSRPTTSRTASLRGLRVEDLFDLLARTGLHFDQARRRAWSSTCSARSPSAAGRHDRDWRDCGCGPKSIYNAERALLEEADAALTAPSLPPEMDLPSIATGARSQPLTYARTVVRAGRVTAAAAGSPSDRRAERGSAGRSRSAGGGPSRRAARCCSR